MENFELTKDMTVALDTITNTKENVFITGKAGTGKTTFLKHVINSITKKKFIVAAPTGVAAINAEGVTLHSLFNIPFGPQCPNSNIELNIPPYKLKVIYEADVLIIDEVSMVRADVIDYISNKMKMIKYNDSPFGGMQIVMFGDLRQLSPVVKKEEGKILDKFYSSPYFFSALVWHETRFKIIELSKIFRQKDQRFIHILNQIRDCSAGPEDLEALDDLRKFDDKENDEHKIHICTHKYEVERINSSNLGESTHTFKALKKGNFPDNSAPCDLDLKLRVGARVMILINDNINHLYCNGTLGEVKFISPKSINVVTDDGCEVELEKHKWENFSYKLVNNKIEKSSIGSCEQFPVTLAWAITIHKSQGLTFDNVVLHIDRTFCSGQLYVALSRCRTMGGITLDSYITTRMMIKDEVLDSFFNKVRENNYYKL